MNTETNPQQFCSEEEQEEEQDEQEEEEEEEGYIDILLAGGPLLPYLT